MAEFLTSLLLLNKDRKGYDLWLEFRPECLYWAVFIKNYHSIRL